MPLTDVKTAEFNAKPIESAHDRVQRAIQARRGVRGKTANAGHCIGSTQNPASGQVHVVGSVLAQLAAGKDLEEGVENEFMRYRKIAGRGRRNILFVVDTSGSMVASGRLGLVKGCVVSLLGDAYVSRTRIAVIGYGGAKARLIVPFTSSAELAAQRIDNAKGGGSTPLIEALDLAARTVQQVDDEQVEIVLLSDGGYNRPRKMMAESAIRGFAEFFKKHEASVMLIDSGMGTKTAQRRAESLAQMLHADYRKLDDLRADTIAEAIG